MRKLARITPMLLGAALLTCLAWADTLHLRDGRQLTGELVSASKDNVRFRSEGKVEKFKSSEVARIEFDSSAAASSVEPATSSMSSSSSTESQAAAGTMQSSTGTIRSSVPEPDKTGAQPATTPQVGVDTSSSTSAATDREQTSSSASSSVQSSEAQSTQEPLPALPPPADKTTSSSMVGTATPAAGAITVPAGTRIVARMIDSVNSDTNKVGDRFRCSLDEDLTVDGKLIAAKGSDCYGRLAAANGAASSGIGASSEAPRVGVGADVRTDTDSPSPSDFPKSTRQGGTNRTPQADEATREAEGASSASNPPVSDTRPSDSPGIPSASASTSAAVQQDVQAGSVSQPEMTLVLTEIIVNGRSHSLAGSQLTSTTGAAVSSTADPNAHPMSSSAELSTQPQAGVSTPAGSATSSAGVSTPSGTASAGVSSQAGNPSASASVSSQATVDTDRRDQDMPAKAGVTTDTTVQTESQTTLTANADLQGAIVSSVISAPDAGGTVGIGAGNTAANILTRGQMIRVPSQTVLEFRTQQPINLSIESR